MPERVNATYGNSEFVAGPQGANPLGGFSFDSSGNPIVIDAAGVSQITVTTSGVASGTFDVTDYNATKDTTNPVYTFIGDVDTGIGSSGANKLEVINGGTAVIETTATAVTVTGVIGLTGATTVTGALHVTTTTALDGAVTLGSTIAGVKHVVEAHTAGDTLLAAESGSIHTNLGAGGAVTLVLPAAVVGLHFHFYVLAAQELRLDPNTTETIALPSTGAQSAAGAYITADAAGEYVEIVCAKAGQWEVLQYRGTWAAV